VYLTSDDVQDILHLLDTLPFGELHLRTESFQLSLQRAADGEWAQTTQVLTPPRIKNPPGAPAAGAPAAGAPAAGSSAPAAAVPAGRSDLLIEVPAPLPGTFYRAPRPGSPPFVEVGTEVGADTVVGIIETMKLMNSVYAGHRGTIAELCVADAELAGQGTVLMRIDPGLTRIDPGPA
jgi:acetyl-CoA carboxylase biotin carboxyl carrier protein